MEVFGSLLESDWTKLLIIFCNRLEVIILICFGSNLVKNSAAWNDQYRCRYAKSYLFGYVPFIFIDGMQKIKYFYFWNNLISV